jgi:hypothetical protein
MNAEILKSVGKAFTVLFAVKSAGLTLLCLASGLPMPPCTGVNGEILKSVGKAFTGLPEEFTPHRQIKKIYEQRRAMIESGGCLKTDAAASCWACSAKFAVPIQARRVLMTSGAMIEYEWY